MSQIHVMHVIDSMHGGGAETSLLEIIPGLAARGVTISIVTILPDDGALECRLDELGVSRTRLTRCGTTFGLRKLMKSEHPDIVHTTLLFANVAGRISARMARVPIITTLANEDYGPEHRAHSRYGAWSVRTAYAADLVTSRFATRFHAVSESTADVMGRRLRIPRDRIQVVYRGRDPTRLGVFSMDRRLKIRTSLSIGPQTPVVLCVARLDRQKGVDTAIDGFHYLVRRVPDAVLLIAGRPGNLEAVVRAQAQGRPAIRILGHRADVPDLMCAADVLSFPSRWEGLGGTLVEAMALRLPIVASKIRPVAETIGNVGWPLVRPDDGHGLAEALASVLERGAENEKRKDAGEKRFRALFTMDVASDGMARLYRDVLRGTG